MYEPKRPPRITKKTVPLPEMRYGIFSGATYVDLLDPTIDPLHIHEYLEIFYNLGDEVSFLVNGTVYPVRAGEILVNRAGDVHVCIFPETKAYRYGCLWIDADFSSPVFSFLKEKDFSPLFSFSEEKEKAVFGLLSELEKIENGEGEDVRALTVLLSILSLFGSAHAENQASAPLPSQLESIVRYINGHFAEIRTVSEICDAFFISTSTLNRRFRTYLHTSPREYIEAKKLAYALQLLKKGASVTEASSEAGFADCSHFIILFKKKFGETPLRYKKQLFSY